MSIPIRNGAPAVPRRVAIFGLLLSLSLALLGIFGSHLVSQINNSYQDIVARQLPSIGIVREVSQTNAQGRRLLDSLGASASTAEIDEVEIQLRLHRDTNSVRLAKLEGLLQSEEGRQLTTELLAARKVYRAEVDTFFKEMRAGSNLEARARWTQRMAAADAHYISAQDRLADYCSRSAASVSEELSKRSARLNSYFLLIAAWPLVLVISFFIYGLCSTLILFYRSRR